MAQPWASTVENLRGPAAPPAPAPTEWTAQKLRAGLPPGSFDRPVGGVPRGAGYTAPGATSYPSAAPATAAPTTPAATETGRARRVLNSLRPSAVADTAKSVLTADLAPSAKALGKSALRGGAPLAVASGAIETATTPTEDFYSRLGIEPEATHVPQLMKDIGVRSLGLLQNVGNAATFGIADRVGSLLTGNGFERSSAAGAEPPAAAPSPRAPDMAAPTDGTPPWRDQPAPQTIPGAPPTGNAAGTFRYNDRSTGKGTVSSLQTPGVGGYLRQLANIRSLGDAPAMMADGTEAPTPGLAGIDGNQTLGSALRAKTDATSSRLPRGLSPRQIATFQQADADRAQRGEIASAQLGVTAQGQAQGLRIAEMSNATQRRNNDQNNASTLRGQDMHLEGQMLPVQLAELRRRAMADAYAPGEGGKPADHLTAADRLDRAGFREEAAAARTAAAQNQTIKGVGEEQARRAHGDLVNLFKGDVRFNIPDPANPGKTIFDEKGAERAAAQLYAEHGEKLDGLSPARKKEFASEIIGTQRLQDRLRRPEMSALDHVANWVGQYKRPADNEALPDLRGAKARRRGATLIPGNMTNDILLDLPDGRTYNAGELSAPETAVLRSRGVNLDR